MSFLAKPLPALSHKSILRNITVQARGTGMHSAGVVTSKPLPESTEQFKKGSLLLYSDWILAELKVSGSKAHFFDSRKKDFGQMGRHQYLYAL